MVADESAGPVRSTVTTFFNEFVEVEIRVDDVVNVADISILVDGFSSQDSKSICLRQCQLTSLGLDDQ